MSELVESSLGPSENPRPPEGHTVRASDAVAWVADVLDWSDRPAAQGGQSFAILPNARRPKLLVPTETGRLAAGALHAYNDSMSQAARLRRAAVAGALRFRLDRLVRVDAATFFPGTSSPSLLDHLETVLGQRVRVSIALVPTPRPNRKPVLRVLSADGTTLAFAKIGWNDLTRRLVADEAAALRTIHAAGLRTIRPPELLHEGVWEGRSIILTSPAVTPLIRRGGRNALPPIEIERELSGSGWTCEQPLGSSDYLAGLRTRMHSLAPASASLLARLEPVVDGLRPTTDPTTFGAWHGDWAPWNMSRSSRTMFVWDWERFGGPVPFGFDRAHHVFQVGTLVRGASVGVTAERAVAALNAIPEVRTTGPDGARTILSLYLIEQILRIEDGRAAGEAVRPGITPAIITYLEDARSTER